MKTKITFLAFFLIFTLISATGQSAPVRAMKIKNISPAGPPTFETTTAGLEIKIWVLSQEENKMVEGMNDQMKMDNGKEGTMKKKGKKNNMTGTHHIKVEVTDATSGETRNDLATRVEVTSPAKKSSWVDLKNMSNHYGQDLTLKEKGTYKFIVRIDDKGVRKSTQFNYTVQ